MSAADEPSVDLSRQIQGRYEGIAGPGNELKIVVQPSATAGLYTFLFDITIEGRYEGRNVSIRGSLTVSREGKAARLAWKNGKSGCDFPLRRAGDGFEGQALRDSCMTAFQVPVPGTWSVHLEPGTLTIRNVESGETLRFRKLDEATSKK
jgi:hypothetical protein